jgi:hypothetical protein
MSLFSDLRAVVLLRRIARALERIAAVEDEKLAMAQEHHAREFPAHRAPRAAEFGRVSVARLNELYAEHRRANSSPDAIPDEELWPDA